MNFPNLGRLFSDVKHQTKILVADHQSIASIADLTFNNLVIGKTYRIGGQILIRHEIAQDISTVLSFVTGGTTHGRAVYNPPSATTAADITRHPNCVFVATATVLTFDFNNAATKISGDGTRDETYITLEEYQRHVEVTDFA